MGSGVHPRGATWTNGVDSLKHVDMPHQSVAAIGMAAISGLPAVAGGGRRLVFAGKWHTPLIGVAG